MTEPRTFAPRERKKPLYTGDPNATMTICVKKLRRHLPSDLQLIIVPPLEPGKDDYNGEVLSEEAIKGAGLDKPSYLMVCRHCKQDPMMHTKSD